MPDEQGERMQPKPPKGLGTAQRTLWKAAIDAYEVQLHHLAILEAACLELRRAELAEAKVATDGEYLKDRYGGVKLHPAVGNARNSRLAAARLLRELGLDLEEDAPRLPRSSGYLPYDRRR